MLRPIAWTLFAQLLWTLAVGVAWVEGWGRRPLAPRGDASAFMTALRAEIDATSRGNAVCALLHEGAWVGEHSFSIGEPITRDHAFQVASLSKWITAWGVMALVDDGRLDLDAPVSRYLSRWQLPPSEFDNDGVTVRRLLSHTAGLDDGLGYAGFAPGEPVESLEASLTRAADASPGRHGAVRVGHPPGERWAYSGGAYTLLQLLIEEVSGEPFARHMQRSVLEPLGMEHSAFDWDEASGVPLATIHDVDGTPATHYRFTARAAASLYTTQADLQRFLAAHLPGAPGQRAGRGVLRTETLMSMWEPHAQRFGQDIWGLGVILYAPGPSGGFVIGHDGNNEPAINTAARIDPFTGSGIVILETGNPLLATRLAGEWVYWHADFVDVLTLAVEAPRVFNVVLGGALAIALAALTLVLARRRGAGRAAR